MKLFVTVIAVKTMRLVAIKTDPSYVTDGLKPGVIVVAPNQCLEESVTRLNEQLDIVEVCVTKLALTITSRFAPIVNSIH